MSPRLLVLAGLAIFAFAGNSLLARAAIGEQLIGAGAFSVVRLVAGAVVLLPVIGRLPRRADIAPAIALLVYVAAFSFAYQALSAATGALILFASVQATVLLGGVSSGGSIGRIAIAGLSLAMAGVVWLMLPAVNTPALLPALVMALAGIGWGLYTLAGRKSDDASGQTARNFLIAAILSLPLAALDVHGPAAQPIGLALATCAGAITSGLGYVIWYRVAPQLGLATVASVQLATPLAAAAGAAVFLAEPIGWRFVLAASAVLVGIAMTMRPPRAISDQVDTA
jgi:drug/metabolite transporter (DMT)-like permease